MAFFSSSYRDARPAWQQGLSQQYGTTFGNLLAQPNFGYDVRRSQVLDPVWARYMQDIERQTVADAASYGRGIGDPNTQGRIAKAKENARLARLQQEYQDQNVWQNFVASNTGQAAAIPTAQAREYQPSGFSQLTSPFMQGMGSGVAQGVAQGLTPNIAKAVGSGFQGLTNWLAPATTATATLPQAFDLFGGAGNVNPMDFSDLMLGGFF